MILMAYFPGLVWNIYPYVNAIVNVLNYRSQNRDPSWNRRLEHFTWVWLDRGRVSHTSPYRILDADAPIPAYVELYYRLRTL